MVELLFCLNVDDSMIKEKTTESTRFNRSVE